MIVITIKEEQNEREITEESKKRMLCVNSLEVIVHYGTYALVVALGCIKLQIQVITGVISAKSRNPVHLSF